MKKGRPMGQKNKHTIMEERMEKGQRDNMIPPNDHPGKPVKSFPFIGFCHCRAIIGEEDAQKENKEKYFCYKCHKIKDIKSLVKETENSKEYREKQNEKKEALKISENETDKDCENGTEETTGDNNE